MKAVYLYRDFPSFVEIHFSLELPVFPKPHGRFRQPMPKVMLSRSADLDHIADLLTNLNAFIRISVHQSDWWARAKSLRDNPSTCPVRMTALHPAEKPAENHIEKVSYSS